jgi:hypothetical protein
MMDNEYHLDFDQILNTIRNADVVAFRFVTVPMRLLIDNRFTEVDPPMLKLVPKAASAEERFKSLKVLRPRFKLPSKISAIWWPRTIESLRDTGVWQAILDRVSSNGFTDAAGEAEEMIAEMRRLERVEMADAIGGSGYRTLWPAGRS